MLNNGMRLIIYAIFIYDFIDLEETNIAGSLFIYKQTLKIGNTVCKLLEWKVETESLKLNVHNLTI